jgi:hypothetical protein
MEVVMKKVEVRLKDGTVCHGDKFDLDDYRKLQKIFSDWQDINRDLKSLGGRNLNVPDVFSEALFCIFFNAVRTNGEAHSYDCVSLDSSAGIQVKSCSIDNDCTSFGPTSTWDELYFADFAPNGYVDGNVWFYKIDCDIYSIVLNAKKGETFKDQQLQGRRPRFSIKSTIIKAQGLKPVLKINLLEDKIPEVED